MGLTLVDQLRKRIDEEIEFKFAVAPDAYEEETHWAEIYGLKTVRRDTMLFYWLQTSWFGRTMRAFRRVVRAILRRDRDTASLRNKLAWDVREVHEEYMAAFQWADLVIDMSGISYVGDGVSSPFAAVHTYSGIYYAQKADKPFARFIQSFGPFDHWLVRYLAKKEFAKLPFIPARGNHSAEYCRQIVSDISKVHAIPDSAVLLPKNESWATEFLQQNSLEPKQYVIVSPSAVIHASVLSSAGGSVGKKHVDSMVKICNGLIERGEKIVFLPHMYSSYAKECDREVARLVAQKIPSGAGIIVEEDIDPMMAKGLIANCKYAIVSRYHALVAALSTGVDVVTVGWNIKYQDMMEYYGKERYAIDMRKHEPTDLAQRALAFADEFNQAPNGTNQHEFEALQTDVKQRVDQAFQMLVDWIHSTRPGRPAGG